MDIPSYGISSQGECQILTVIASFVAHVFNALIAYFVADGRFGCGKMSNSTALFKEHKVYCKKKKKNGHIIP